MSEKVNCIKCKHYYTTWDPQIPRGCKFYGFKSAKMPSIAVKNESGDECRGFEERKAKKKDGLDLNDPSLW